MSAAANAHAPLTTTQAQAVAARLYDEVRRQQVRTQMVINDALMLCSPAFGSVAANIKAARKSHTPPLLTVHCRIISWV